MDQVLDALKATGLSEDEAKQVAVSLDPLVRAVFEKRVYAALTAQDIEVLDTQLDEANELDGVSKLEAVYEGRTNKNFLILYTETLQDMVSLWIRALKETRLKLADVSKLPADKLKQVVSAIEENDIQKVQQLVEI